MLKVGGSKSTGGISAGSTSISIVSELTSAPDTVVPVAVSEILPGWAGSATEIIQGGFPMGAMMAPATSSPSIPSPGYSPEPATFTASFCPGLTTAPFAGETMRRNGLSTGGTAGSISTSIGPKTAQVRHAIIAWNRLNLHLLAIVTEGGKKVLRKSQMNRWNWTQHSKVGLRGKPGTAHLFPPPRQSWAINRPHRVAGASEHKA